MTPSVLKWYEDQEGVRCFWRRASALQVPAGGFLLSPAVARSPQLQGLCISAECFCFVLLGLEVSIAFP